MVNSPHAATISIDGLDALVLKKLSLPPRKMSV